MSGFLDDVKKSEIISRLEHEDTNSALAAEAELSVLWAISKVAHLVPEPSLEFGTKRPDAYSNNLFASGPAVLEIRALSDENFSGREAMNRTANIISNYADHLIKGAGKHLYFEFLDQSYYNEGRFHRERCVDPHFQLSKPITTQLRKWVTASDWPNPDTIRLTEGKTDVVISWKQKTIPLFRTFCRMPPVAYDLEDNPVYKALKKKANQVKGAAKGILKCVVLVDAGSNLLRRLQRLSGSSQEVGGEAIIRHALSKLNLDIVIVISPYRHNEFVFASRSHLLWNITCFDRRSGVPDGEYDCVKEMAAQFPRPRYEGYQARDLHKQGGFKIDRRNWHLNTHMKWIRGNKMTVKISAALLHEYLAGRIDVEYFQKKAFGDGANLFEKELTRGHSIRNMHFEAMGIDEDDDYIVIDLDIDWDKISRKVDGSSK